MADQLQSPVLPEDLVTEAVPGNIRRAEHFVALLRRVVNFFRRYTHVERAQCEGPLSMSHKLEEDAEVDSKSLKFCHERLRSLTLGLQGAGSYCNILISRLVPLSLPSVSTHTRYRIILYT